VALANDAEAEDRALLRVAPDVDLTHARELLALITSRGYHRVRSLIAEFDALLPHHP
jgi:hypothetical protein